MPWTEPKTNWQAADGVTNSDMNRIEGNIKGLREDPTMDIYQTAAGTGTAITLTGLDLSKRFLTSFVVLANNNGAATTINGIALYKPGTTQAPTLVAGKLVSVWYNGTHFFIKASAEGNAVAGDVLAGKTFSNDNDTGLVGTIPTATTTSPYEDSSELYVTNGAAWLRTQGNKYWPDKTWIKFNEPNLTPANIKAGVTIGSTTKITGTFTDDADAVAGNILASKTAYVKGNKVTGNIPSKAAATITPKATAQTIPANQYLSGVQTIAGDANLVPANILQGKSIFGVAGVAPVVYTGLLSDATRTGVVDWYGYDTKNYTETSVAYNGYIVSQVFPTRPKIVLLYGRSNYSGGEPALVFYYENTAYPGRRAFIRAVDAINYHTKEYNTNTPAYVTTAGFCLPAGASTGTTHWMAIL